MDPASGLWLFWHSSSIGRSNLARYSNHRADELIEAARHSIDPAFRRRTYLDINTILRQDIAATFLFFRNQYNAASSRIVINELRMGSIFAGVRKWHIEN